jgi:hypothetical protein
LRVEIDVAPLLREGRKPGEVVTDVDTLHQAVELRDLLIEFRGLGLALMESRRVLLLGRLHHLGAGNIACDH